MEITLGYKRASIEKKRKKSINQRLKKSKRKQKRKKEKKKRDSLDQTMFEQCAELSKANRKENSNSNNVQSPAQLQAKSLCPLLFRAEPKRKGNKKGKSPNDLSQISHQNPTS